MAKKTLTFTLLFFFSAPVFAGGYPYLYMPSDNKQTSKPVLEEKSVQPERSIAAKNADLGQTGKTAALSAAEPAKAAVQKTGDELAPLFIRLRNTPDAGAATRIAREIQSKWLRSGQHVTNLLMIRATRAIASGDNSTALDMLARIIALEPTYVEAWNHRASIHFKAGRLSSSLRDIERVLALEPRHWGALSGLGAIFYKMSKGDAALRVYRKLLHIYPTHSGAVKAVSMLEKKHGDKLI